MCVVKLCVCVSKLYVSKLCVIKLCVCVGKCVGKKEKAAGGRGGRKQEPHTDTKMWGKIR